MLYIVSTPIGNLKDISQRALEILNSVDVILAESPQDSLRLLNFYKIKKEIIAYNDRNKKKVINKILNLLSDSHPERSEGSHQKYKIGKTAAYITSAGTPGVSDPGQDLVQQARERGIAINVIPGPSALISAIAVSGIRAREFTFVSFPPKKSGALKNLFEKYKKEETVLSFFESPFRVLKTLESLKTVSPDCYVFVAKELTKMFENYFYGTPDEVIAKIKESPKNLKGEFTIVVDFNPLSPPAKAA